ncbi:MAG: M23 family metallopeptidase [Deltaproteobacteria bacterium]|nr:M23 family metallopeptidase [Deltaproteobacteria bacterium]
MTRWIGVWALSILIIWDISAGWSLELNFPETAYQGDMVVGRSEPAAEVWIKGKRQMMGPQGYFVLPVPRGQKTDFRVTVKSKAETRSRIIRILAYPWRIQKIKGLPQQYVTPPPKKQERVVSDNRKVQNVRDSHPYPVPFFIRKGFIKPVSGTVTSPFGLSRVLNGKPKSFHSGVDIAAPLGHPVRCPADGIVRLVDADMFLMGKTLMIDHGLGVTSIFIHLNAITVNTGDLVRQGELIAHVGKTGRATGPHLHWGVSAGRTPLDPLRLINRQFSYNK